MSTLPVLIIGGGGHGRVVLDALICAGHNVLGVCDPNPGVAARLPEDIPYLGGDEAAQAYDRAAVLLANGVGSIADTTQRQAVFDGFALRGYRFLTLRHPSAILADDAVIGEGTQLHAGSIVQTGARIGANVLLNTGAQVDHDCEIGAHCHLAPGVVLSGGVRIGPGCHVGTGAVVIQNLAIGAGAVIGAGALILRDVAPGERVTGRW